MSREAIVNVENAENFLGGSGAVEFIEHFGPLACWNGALSLDNELHPALGPLDLARLDLEVFKLFGLTGTRQIQGPHFKKHFFWLFPYRYPSLHPRKGIESERKKK